MCLQQLFAVHSEAAPGLISLSPERTATAGAAPTGAAEGTADWQATVKTFVQKVKVAQPPMPEMGWYVVVVNSACFISGLVKDR